MNGRSKPSGSSPHTRGALGEDNARDDPARIIPAYAGSTGGVPRDAVRTGDHPRIRGEHAATSTVVSISPTDHPRIRGEHRRRPTLSCRTRGSSPHTRGAPSGRPRRKSGRWIIPAYAGSTVSLASIRATARDHPRIRGEHPHVEIVVGREIGSSPHTRGAPPYPSGRRRTTRIIPAYAGSTPGRLHVGHGSGDHPRIRGEHFATRRPRMSMPGSSPHTRGAPWLMSSIGPVSGIIPAYAGSTGSR